MAGPSPWGVAGPWCFESLLNTPAPQDRANSLSVYGSLWLYSKIPDLILIEGQFGDYPHPVCTTPEVEIEQPGSSTTLLEATWAFPRTCAFVTNDSDPHLIHSLMLGTIVELVNSLVGSGAWDGGSGENEGDDDGWLCRRISPL